MKANWPWIALTFSGDGWTAHTIQTVLADLRADLAQRRIDLDLASNHRKGAADAIAFIDIAKEGATAVAIQVDIPEGGATRRLSRVTALDAVPNDGRPLAIALTAGELLRVSWVRIALRRAADKVAALQPETGAAPSRVLAAPSPPAPVPAPTATAAEPGGMAAQLVPAPPAAAALAAPPLAGEKGAVAVNTPPVPAALSRPPSSDTSPAKSADPTVTLIERAPPSPEQEDTSRILNVGIAVGGAFLIAPPTSTRNVPRAPGVSLRAMISGHRIGASLGLLLPAATMLDLGDAMARERRYVMDASFRSAWRGDRVSLAMNLGLFVGYRRIEGVGLVRTAAETGIDWGAHTEITAAFGRGRLAPWLGVVAEVLPVPPAIAFLPAGNAGNAPTLWVGLGAGMAFRLMGSGAP